MTMSETPLAREVVASLPKPYFEFLVTSDTAFAARDPEGNVWSFGTYRPGRNSA